MDHATLGSEQIPWCHIAIYKVALFPNLMIVVSGIIVGADLMIFAHLFAGNVIEFVKM